jgi:membrane-associated phospholipid phosphatase
VGDLFALTTVDKTTAIIKQSTNRTRPDGSDNESFPSGHTSQAFSAARIISDNLQYYNFSDEAQTNIRYGAYAFATGTAWARVEAKKHHPTDVLIGAALGNFMTIFFNELFKGNENVKAKVEVDTVENEVQLGVNWRF